jgi:hypothetical protein
MIDEGEFVWIFVATSQIAVFLLEIMLQNFIFLHCDHLQNMVKCWIIRILKLHTLMSEYVVESCSFRSKYFQQTIGWLLKCEVSVLNTSKTLGLWSLVSLESTFENSKKWSSVCSGTNVVSSWKLLVSEVISHNYGVVTENECISLG